MFLHMPHVAPRFLAALLVAAAANAAEAAVVYSTTFDSASPGTLANQQAWTGTAGTWAVSASVNTGLVGYAVLSSDNGVTPSSGTGQMVRVATSRFGNDRTKAWLDILNSGKWAAASAGGNDVLETSIKIFVPSGLLQPCHFGIMISKDSATTGSGFVINGQTGAVSYLDNGYAAANRFPFNKTVSLGAWHSCVFRWNPTTGAASLAIDGEQVGSYVSTVRGGVYAVNMFSFTDFSGTSALTQFAYMDDYSLNAVPAALPCPGDFDGNRVRDGADLGFLLGNWGTAATDLTGDGVTDGADLGVLLGNWGACP
jgi:hypothetical protein